MVKVISLTPPQSSVKIVFIACLSVLIHMLGLRLLIDVNKWATATKQVMVPVSLEVREKKPLKLPPKPTRPPQQPAVKKPELRRPKNKPVEKARKVQGLTEESISPVQNEAPAPTMKAPLGNTLMQKDEGQRLTAEQLASLKQDLSQDALLIPESFKKPSYTEQALDAELEGDFIVDVFVDEQGRVLKVELRKPIGFGMDERIREAAQNARFIPKKNARGGPVSGWAEIHVLLELP